MILNKKYILVRTCTCIVSALLQPSSVDEICACHRYKSQYRKWESFAGLNFCGFHSFLEEHESFSYESFALSTTYKHPGLAL